MKMECVIQVFFMQMVGLTFQFDPIFQKAKNKFYGFHVLHLLLSKFYFVEVIHKMANPRSQSSLLIPELSVRIATYFPGLSTTT